MLTRPLTLNDGKDRGRGLVAVTLHTALPLVAEHDDVTQTGVFSPPAVPSWRSSSSPSSPTLSSASSQYPPSFLSSPSSTSPPLLATGSLPVPVSSSPSPPPLPLISSTANALPSSLACPPPPLPLAPGSPRHSFPLFSSSPLPQSLHPSPHSFPSVCSPPPPQVPPVSLPAPSLSSYDSPPFSSLSLPPPPPSVLFFSRSHLPSLSPPPPASPPCFASTSSILPSPLSSSSPPPPLPPGSPPPLPLSSSTPLVSIIPTPSSLSPPHSIPLCSSSHPGPSSFHRSPPSSSMSICTSSPPPPPALVPFPPPPTHDACPLSSAPSLPPLPTMCSPLLSSSPPAPPYLSSQHPPPSSPPHAPPLPPPAHCCPCSSLLPRILSAHRLEVRRLLRGAVASLGRRLDSLERRSRKKAKKKGSRQRREEGGGTACSSGLGAFPLGSASSCGSSHLHLGTTCSSSSTDNIIETPPQSTSLSQSELRCSMVEEEEEGEQWGRKRRKTHHRGRETSLCPEYTEEDEDAGRFVGRMEVSFRGGVEGEEEVPLTLNNFNHSKRRRREGGEACQSQKAISVVRQNGYRVPLLHSLWSTPSQNALQSAQACSRSEALNLMSSQWRFTDSTSLLTSSNHRAFHLWLCASSFNPAPMFQLSAVAMETISNSLRGGACGSPSRPLKDWTAPPSLSSDHCYMRLSSLSTTFPARRQQKLRTNHSSRSLLTRRRPLPLPSCSSNGLPALLPSSQGAAGSEFLSTKGERGKRVSQIRIRRAPPREASLTPMGLPKAKRLKKKEFSLEEIYTNKNYKSPSTNRSLETIFEEPREKDGALLLIGQQKRRRVLLFPDFTQPRKRKRLPGAGLPVAMVPRKRAAARRQCHGSSLSDDESDLDVMLVERLSALEDFLSRNGLDL